MPPIFNNIAEVILITVVFPHVMVLGDAASFCLVDALVIPGPKEPKKQINIFLCLLMEELKELW
jgi:hypothetical protein